MKNNIFKKRVMIPVTVILLAATVYLWFVFAPIPAGVLLYLIASNCFQVLQTVIINKQLEAEDVKKAARINDDVVADAKKIQEK